MRLNLRLTGTAETLILNIAKATDLPPKEVILDAIALYNSAYLEIKHGGKLGVRDKENTFTAITTPTLHAFAKALNDSDKE